MNAALSVALYVLDSTVLQRLLITHYQLLIIEMQQIVCFGEVLWDMLPSGKLAGGAPMNVAYHLNNFGQTALMISKVGDDALGTELLEFLQANGITTDLIQTDTQLPTGTVQVSLDEHGSPTYEIVAPVAWDKIEHEEGLLELLNDSDAFVYGSLAARDEQNRQTLLRLLQTETLKIFDINLRPPFYNKALLEELLHHADIVKVNEEELQMLKTWYNLNGDTFEYLSKHFNIQKICVTRGEKGSFLYYDGKTVDMIGMPVNVKDTIGSGDAFLAAFISKTLEGCSASEVLAYAGATGAVVATYQGATPDVSVAEIEDFLNAHTA